MLPSSPLQVLLARWLPRVQFDFPTTLMNIFPNKSNRRTRRIHKKNKERAQNEKIRNVSMAGHFQDESEMKIYLINIQVGECPTPNNITGIIILFFSLSLLNSATHYPSLVHQTPSKKSKNIHCTQFIHRCIHRISPIEHSRRYSFCESSITPILYRNQKMVYLALVAANKFFFLVVVLPPKNDARLL